MATYDIGAIRSALKTLLESVSGIEVVYDSMNPVITGYPAIIFDLDNEDAVMLDDANNTRTLTFKLWIACEIPNAGMETARDLLDNTTKNVVNVLEKISNQTLSGNVDWMIPVIGKRDQSNSPEGNFYYQELLLRVNVVSSIL